MPTDDALDGALCLALKNPLNLLTDFFISGLIKEQVGTLYKRTV